MSYRYPVHSAPEENDARAVARLSVHSRGPVLSAFTAVAPEGQRLVTVGQADGSLMVWDLSA
jgi:hypothetical protein